MRLNYHKLFKFHNFNHLYYGSDETDAVAEFRHIKAEMHRLGFKTFEEYEAYLYFLEIKRAMKRNFQK